MTRFARLLHWLRVTRNDIRLLEAERVRYRNMGEMEHSEDRAEVSEWGTLG